MVKTHNKIAFFRRQRPGPNGQKNFRLRVSNPNGICVTEYLEDHPRTDGYVVNNHGDRFRPLSVGLWDPLQMALQMAYKWG